MSGGCHGPDPDDVGYDGGDCQNPATLNPGTGDDSSEVLPEGCTYCDLDIVDNVWVEGVVDLSQNKRGICMLNTMTREQVIYVLQHNPRARRDLPRVTSNPDLLQLLAEVPLLPTINSGDVQQRKAARQGLPFYTVFRGRPPAAAK